MSPAFDGRAQFRRSRVDGATFLTLYAVLLMALPARLVVGPLGGAGSPAILLGITGSLWWAANAVADLPNGHGHAQPVRRAVLVFATALLASYVAGTTRPLAAVELRAMETGMLNLVAWLGVVLVAADGIPDVRRLDVLLRRIGLLAGLEATLGIVQFATGHSFTDLIQIPGLSANATLLGVGERDGFFRPAGTAIHSIEFGVTLTALLPLCLHVALQPDWAGPFRRWFPVVSVAVAIPLSISRSAIVGTLVVFAVLAPTWTRRMRTYAAAAAATLLFAIFVLVPGFLGAVSKLFTGIGSDPSALSRTDSYTLAWEFIQRAPLFGRGFSTFLPEYRILDNQYLGLLIEAGAVGVLALVGAFVTGFVVALLVRRRSTDPGIRSVAQSLAASIAAMSVGYAFFDAFSFPQASGVSFLVLGLIGALYRLHRQSAAQHAGTRDNGVQIVMEATTTAQLGDREGKARPE